MLRRSTILTLPFLILILSPVSAEHELVKAGEKHFGHVEPLTQGGQNAEAYLSPDDQWITFQSTSGDLGCDQIFVMKTDGTERKMVSTGKGRTTCSYFLDARTVIYASTHLADEQCPPKPDHSEGYVWPVYPGYDLFTVDVGSGDVSKPARLTESAGYDAEATVSHDGKRIVFTSTRDGDLDLYTMNVDGTEVTRITTSVGYDGGAFFSPDGTKVVYRAFHPRDDKEMEDYKRLLAKDLFRPSWLEVFVANADGSDTRKVTDLGVASFCPSWYPDGKRIIFSSNKAGKRVFELYSIDVNGKNLEQITQGGEFEGFPVFTRDGKKLVWASNRHGRAPRETNIFIADWIP